MNNQIELFEAVEHHKEADSFDFRRSWESIRHACRGHRILIALVVALTFGLTLAYVRIWPPIFSATVTLVGESNQDVSRGTFYQTWNVFRSDHLPDEVHMITAGPVLAEVIQRLKLTDSDVYHSFFGYAGVLWTKSWVGRTYREFKDRLFPPAHDRYEPTPEQVANALTLTNLKTGVQLERVMESNLGTLVVRGPTKQVAEVANTIVAVYLQQRRDRHIQEAASAYDALELESVKAQDEIALIEQRMREYYSDNGILLSFEKDKIDIGQMQAMKASVDDLKASISSNDEMLKQIATELGSENRFVVSASVTGINPLRDNLRTRLNDLQISRKQSLIHFQPDSPEIAEIDRQIAIVSDQMAREPRSNAQQQTTVVSSHYEALRGKAAEIRTTLAGQRASLQAKSATYETYRTLLAGLPEKMRAVHDMEREHDAAEKKFGVIREKMMIAAVSRASARSDSDSLRVVEAASIPAEPVWPRTKILLAGSVAIGLFAGVLLALLLDLFFGRVHRFRLADSGELQVYATVYRDRASIQELFAMPEMANGDVRLLPTK